MADAEPEVDEEIEVKPKSGNTLVLIVLVLNLLLTGGVAALVLLKPDPAPPPAAAADAPKTADAKAAEVEDAGPAAKANDETVRGPMVELDNVIVQLRNPEFDRYVRMKFQIEVKEEDDQESVKGAVPIIRDKFIAYLSDRSYEELRGSGGLERTKSVLYQRLVSVVPKDRIRGLYVTNFVVQ